MSSAPQTAVEASEDASGRWLRWPQENPIARGIARIPLPIRAKQIFGTFVVAALLALVAVVGLVALGQSNSRGEQLRRLQQQAVYEQLLLTDTNQLKAAIDYRLLSTASTKHFGTPSDEIILNQVTQLCDDAGLDAGNSCVSASGPTRLPLKLGTIAPALVDRLSRKQDIFFSSSSGPGISQGSVVPGSPAPAVVRILKRADRFAGSFAGKLETLARGSQVRADSLVAADHSSFARSRDLLIGVGAGSLALALALGLLLSDALLVPLRTMQSRLAAIAAGDFSGKVEVPNRDEIGALAADVNRMSDELQRVHRELELASEHKSQFLANMSHELRTPLNAIIGFSEVLREQMFGELNERQLAYVEDVLAAGEHLLSLINDVLDLAKIEAGRMDLELSQVEIPDLLRTAVSMHSERAGRSGVSLSLATEPAEIEIIADERRVRQIVFNLLSNAVKFTPSGGHVDISARTENGQVEIAVADTGHGIAAEDLDTIFKEFEQTSEGKRAEGTGLGLPLSRKLAELHGGRLWAQSELGKGSTFRFSLPVEQEVS